MMSPLAKYAWACLTGQEPSSSQEYYANEQLSALAANGVTPLFQKTACMLEAMKSEQIIPARNFVFKYRGDDHTLSYSSISDIQYYQKRYGETWVQSFATYLSKLAKGDKNGGKAFQKAKNVQNLLDQLGEEVKKDTKKGNVPTWALSDGNVDAELLPKITKLLNSHIEYVIETSGNKKYAEMIPCIWVNPAQIAPYTKGRINAVTPIVIIDRNTSYYEDVKFLNTVYVAAKNLGFSPFWSDRGTENLANEKESYKILSDLSDRHNKKILVFSSGCGSKIDFFVKKRNLVWYSPFDQTCDCGCDLLPHLRKTNFACTKQASSKNIEK